MLQSILSNIAIILLMHLTMSLVANFRKKFSPILVYISNIFIISASVICMFYLPIRFDGYWVDMRFIPLVFLAYIQGWKVAIPSLLITTIWRIFMGGVGMVPGIFFGMICPTLLALAFHHRSMHKGHYLKKIGLVFACWLICDLPIIFIMPNGLEIFKSVAFIRSFSFIVTAIILYIFITQDRQRRSLHDELEKLAGEDPLTQLSNKREFFKVVNKKVTQLNPKHFIAMMDIDNFKRLNDTYGHVIGDEILIEIGKILKKYENNHIKVGRYGGEEFIVYLGNTIGDHATKIIEEIRREIRSTSFLLNTKMTIHVTVSIGLAELEKNTPLLHIVNLADENLYIAKNNGRDCIVTPHTSPIPSRFSK